MTTFNLDDAHQVADEYFCWVDLTGCSLTHNVGKINQDT